MSIAVHRVFALSLTMILSACAWTYSPVDGPNVDYRTHINHKEHQVTLLEVGHQALLARIHHIRQAQKSINIQTFIWSNDEVGRLMMYELIKAAKRGVKVRILADQMFSSQDPEVMAFVATVHPNLKIKHYNPNTDRIKAGLLGELANAMVDFRKMNQRMHNKIITLDGRVGFAGGRNIENSYFDYSTELNFKDRDVLLEGPVVKSMNASFEKYWNFPLSIPSLALSDVAEIVSINSFQRFESPADFDIADIKSLVDAHLNNKEAMNKTIWKKRKTVNKIAFYVDEPGKNQTRHLKGSGAIVDCLAAVLKGAEDSLTIQSPYLVLSERAIELFEDLKKENKKIKINISSNSLVATDSWPTYAMSYKQKWLMVNDLGLQIYEIKPFPADLNNFWPTYQNNLKRRMAEDKVTAMSLADRRDIDTVPYFCLHSKSFVVDSQVACVGSYNLDPRSENLNSETVVVIWDEAFADQLKRNIERDMHPENSWVVAKRKRITSLSQVRDLVHGVNRLGAKITKIDLLPEGRISSFELLPSKENVPPGHKHFYKNFKAVGNFPMVKATDDKRILTGLFKAFGVVVLPIL